MYSEILTSHSSPYLEVNEYEKLIINEQVRTSHLNHHLSSTVTTYGKFMFVGLFWEFHHNPININRQVYFRNDINTYLIEFELKHMYFTYPIMIFTVTGAKEQDKGNVGEETEACTKMWLRLH